jgi:hypothetical protein
LGLEYLLVNEQLQVVARIDLGLLYLLGNGLVLEHVARRRAHVLEEGVVYFRDGLRMRHVRQQRLGNVLTSPSGCPL